MPIFEYKCKSCGHKFEELVLEEREKIQCPKCKSSQLEKLISAPNISKSSSSKQKKEGTCPLCQINP